MVCGRPLFFLRLPRRACLRFSLTSRSVYDICRLQTADRRLQTADCRLQTADCTPQTADRRPQTADRRPQTADCRLQIADCKLNDTKNLPNKSDVFKNIKSCESEKVALEIRLIFLCKVTLASYPKCCWLFFTDPLSTHPAYH